MRIVYRVENDYLVKDTEVKESDLPAEIPASNNYIVYKTEVILTKDAFIECYNKWIKDPNSES